MRGRLRRIFWPDPPDEVTHREMTADERRVEATTDRRIEIEERAAIPCLDCEIGEPHVCERAWWQQRLDHLHGDQCIDDECSCHFLTVLAYRPRAAAAPVGGRSQDEQEQPPDG